MKSSRKRKFKEATEKTPQTYVSEKVDELEIGASASPPRGWSHPPSVDCLEPTNADFDPVKLPTLKPKSNIAEATPEPESSSKWEKIEISAEEHPGELSKQNMAEFSKVRAKRKLSYAHMKTGEYYVILKVIYVTGFRYFVYAHYYQL